MEEKQFDIFTNYTFSNSEWSAPRLKYADEIKEALDKMKLVGRRIKRMRMIGLSYYHRRDWIEEAAYSQLSDLPEDERQRKSQYRNISPDTEFSRRSEIDEPFLIKFDDGDVFEIDTPADPYYQFSMNHIPWQINAGTNLPNVDADKLFSPCIGRKITDVEINAYKAGEPGHIYFTPLNSIDEEREFVSSIVLLLENGMGIAVEPSLDYCSISCGKGDWCDVIKFKDLKDALFNYEDLHNDDTLGFEGSNTLYFGEKGAEYTETPYMSLVPPGGHSPLHIAADDFGLLGRSMTNILGSFDIYDNYSLPRNQWNDILNEAEKILSFKTFDDLFDYIVEYNNGLWYMNVNGVSFWKNREKYKTQLADVIKWSELVLKENDVLKMYGF